MIEKYTCIEFPYFKIIGDCNDEGSSGLFPTIVLLSPGTYMQKSILELDLVS